MPTAASMWVCSKTATTGGICRLALQICLAGQVTRPVFGAMKPAMINASSRYYFWFYGFQSPWQRKGHA
jgi:hypothetical protein